MLPISFGTLYLAVRDIQVSSFCSSSEILIEYKIKAYEIKQEHRDDCKDFLSHSAEGTPLDSII